MVSDSNGVNRRAYQIVRVGTIIVKVDARIAARTTNRKGLSLKKLGDRVILGRVQVTELRLEKSCRFSSSW